MRMPAAHRRNPCRNRIEIQRHPVMQHIDRLPAQFHQLRLRKPPKAPAPIDIPPNRRHRSNLPKLVEDGRIADIARMQNVLDASHRRNCLRPKQPMGIRDDADQHRYSPILSRVRGSR